MNVHLHIVVESATAPAPTESSDSPHRGSIFTVEGLQLRRPRDDAAASTSDAASSWLVAPCTLGATETVGTATTVSASSVEWRDLRGRCLYRSRGGKDTGNNGESAGATVTATETAEVLVERLRRLRRRITAADDDDAGRPAAHRVAQSNETIFFLGSRHGTRKDALFITSVHRLLVEALWMVEGCTPSLPSPEIDVALVDHDELWGAGDVLASEAAAAPTVGGGARRRRGSHALSPPSPPLTSPASMAVTWVPLSAAIRHATPGEEEVPTPATAAQLVRRRLAVWFERIDSATAAFPAAPTASPRSPPAAGERLRHLEGNAVFVSLRLRHRSSAASFLTVALLPECPSAAAAASVWATSGWQRGSSAALWREYEALSAFTQSLQHCRHGGGSVAPHSPTRTSAATAALHTQVRAAALRRSRWLSTVAHLHDTSLSPTDDAVRSFLACTTSRSIAWVGCITAAPCHQRHTRSTLSFLARLQPRGERGGATAKARRHHHRRHDDVAGRRSEGAAQDSDGSHVPPSSPTSSPPPSPRHPTEVPQPHLAPRRTATLPATRTARGTITSNGPAIMDGLPGAPAGAPRHDDSCDRSFTDGYTLRLEATVALYEQKLALMDYYVAPTLKQCVEDLDCWQKRSRSRRCPAQSSDVDHGERGE
ncbi:hypothetical protein NESM_000871000 [Novymonas esmeraldas]|uniref:Uncharacterized protein n=1 Tax=Novymonas esmeraldas TaxID=1808958 RepID=A0AAW0EY13_9TRYP